MSEKQHRAFFASPFAEDYRWIREAVAAACRELRIEFRPVDEMVMPGTNIVPAIHHEIAQATLAVAVISGLNPNVMYELASPDPALIQQIKTDIQRLNDQLEVDKGQLNDLKEAFAASCLP